MKDIKIKRIFRDSSDFIYGVAFEIRDEKYLVQEKDAEGEDFLTLYQVDKQGSRNFLQRVNCNFGDLGKACQCNIEKFLKNTVNGKKLAIFMGIQKSKLCFLFLIRNTI